MLITLLVIVSDYITGYSEWFNYWLQWVITLLVTLSDLITGYSEWLHYWLQWVTGMFSLVK